MEAAPLEGPLFTCGGVGSWAPGAGFAEVDGKVAEGAAGVDDYGRGGGGGGGVNENRVNRKVVLVICTVDGAGGGGFVEGVSAEGRGFQGVNCKLNIQFTPIFSCGRGGVQTGVFLKTGGKGRHGDRPAKLGRMGDGF